MSWSSSARQPPVPPPGHRHIAIPEQAVMHQQQRRRLSRLEGRDHPVDRGLRGVHRCDDAADRAAVLDLESVDGVRLVRYLPDAQIPVEVRDHIGQRHVGSSTRRSAPTAARLGPVERDASMRPAGGGYQRAGNHRVGGGAHPGLQRRGNRLSRRGLGT